MISNGTASAYDNGPMWSVTSSCGQGNTTVYINLPYVTTTASWPANNWTSRARAQAESDRSTAKDWCLVECCCPPPVPLSLCTTEPEPARPKEAPRGAARLARLYGGTRERRGLRARRVERKDAVMR